MPRREGEVFFFGTAIEITPEIGARARWRSPETVWEGGLIEDRSAQG
jgi:hypothetical protein